MAHTPGPKLCGRCGEPQPETQDWFGEAVRMKAINADLLAALKQCIPWLHSMPLPAGHQHLRDKAAKTLNDAEAAIAHATK